MAHFLTTPVHFSVLGWYLRHNGVVHSINVTSFTSYILQIPNINDSISNTWIHPRSWRPSPLTWDRSKLTIFVSIKQKGSTRSFKASVSGDFILCFFVASEPDITIYDIAFHTTIQGITLFLNLSWCKKF